MRKLKKQAVVTAATLITCHRNLPAIHNLTHCLFQKDVRVALTITFLDLLSSCYVSPLHNNRVLRGGKESLQCYSTMEILKVLKHKLTFDGKLKPNYVKAGP